MSALSRVRGVNVSKDDTRRMEDEARRMELKMDALRKTMDPNGGNGGAESGGRWRSGSAKKPIRTGYVKEVLGAKPGRASASKPALDKTRARAAAEGSDAASGQTTPQHAEADCTFASALVPSDCLPTEATKKAANNLQAALQQQSNDGLEVESFLAGLGLDRYVSLFMEHGFDCMEVVKEMEESHMRDIGMAAGHALKLRKRLAELSPAPAPAPAAAPAPAPAPVAAPAATQSGALSATQKRRVSFGNTEQTAIPSPSGGSGTCTGGGSLLDGEFDEAANEASFKDAVNAWRGEVKVEAFATEAQAAPGSSSFWSTVGADDVNIAPVSAPSSTMVQCEVQHDSAQSEEKLCCYQCYKQFFAKHAVERCSPLPGDENVRRLCSEACASLWVVSVQAKAEEVQQRQEKLAKLEEMNRLMQAAEAAAEPVLAA